MPLRAISVSFSGQKSALLLLCALLGSSAWASSSSSSNSLVLVGAFERKSAVALELPAQVLAFQVQILTATDEWEVRWREMEAARSQLAGAAEKQGFRLRTTNAVMLSQGYGKSLAFSSSGRSEVDVKSNVLLLADLDEKTDLVEVVRRARVLLTRTPLPKGVTLGIGEVRLGLEDPEKFRPDLLKKIRQHLDLTAQALGDDVEIAASGLEEPIAVRQSGERNVELSLPMRVSYTRKAK